MAELTFILFEALGYILFIATFYFAMRKGGIGEAAFFFVPAILWGFFLEYSTMSLSHRYIYNEGFLLYLFGVPLSISFFWATLIFASMYLLKEKFESSRLKLILYAPIPLILVDLFVLEPAAKTFGYWTWTPESVWFGSPIGNAVGWYLAIALFVAMFNYVNGFEQKTGRIIGLVAGLIAIAVLLFIGLAIWGFIFGPL